MRISFIYKLWLFVQKTVQRDSRSVYQFIVHGVLIACFWFSIIYLYAQSSLCVSVECKCDRIGQNSVSTSYCKRGIIVITINEINDNNKFQNYSILFDKGDYSENN